MVVVVVVVVVASQRGKGRSETERKGPVDSSVRTGGHLGGVSERERERGGPPSRPGFSLSLSLSPGFACLFFSHTHARTRTRTRTYTHTHTRVVLSLPVARDTKQRIHSSAECSFSLAPRVSWAHGGRRRCGTGSLCRSNALNNVVEKQQQQQ